MWFLEERRRWRKILSSIFKYWITDEGDNIVNDSGDKLIFKSGE